MRKYFVLIYLSVVTLGFSQNPEIKSDLPTVIPPSPTVAALMKFEEVPVSNYTGIPDVSIPLFNSSTLSKNVSLNLSLKYHPSSVAVDERSSDVGLGWSLFAGGTISRTVRGMPDEILIYPSGGQSPAGDQTGKIGLYHTNLPHDSNNYYYFMNNVVDTLQHYYKPFLSQQVQDVGNEFLWTATNKGKYDTEHDLWQFNFMGKSGRFYIKKNQANQLVIVPLDDYRMKIINHYSTVNGNSYVPNSFTIIDEIGNRYLFDIIETSRNSGGTTQMDYNINVGYTFSGSLYTEKIFSSAFHLSKVFDQNNKLLFQINYSDPRVEGFSNVSFTKNEYQNLTNYLVYIHIFNACLDFPGLEVTNVSNTIVNVRKIESIDVIGKGKIVFEFNQGRLDSNINNGSTTSYLNSLTFKDLNNNQIQKYTFEYEYITHYNNQPSSISVFLQRLFLKRMNVIDKNNTLSNHYKFEYKENNTNGKLIGKDSWGYFNLSELCELTTQRHKDPSPEFSTTDILQKITYPTGGCVIFDYEANQFSYIGNVEILNFDENPKSFTKYFEDVLYFNSTNTVEIITPVNFRRKIVFRPSIILSADPNNNSITFSLQKKVNGNWVFVESLFCPASNQNCCLEFVFESNTEYRVQFNNLNYTNSSETIIVEYFNYTPKSYLFGGGNRIKKVGYFDIEVSKEYYDLVGNSSLNSPVKEKIFSYSFFNNPLKSSGSLAFAKPLFEYTTSFTTVHSIAFYQAAGCQSQPSHLDHSFQTLTSYNNLNLTKTHGADVGYKEVSVFETNNGRTEFTFTSPIDFPEVDIPTGPPFIPTMNVDYKRGLPIKEVIYDENSRKLSESTKTYTFTEFLNYTGVRFRKPFGQCFTGNTGSVNNSYTSFLAYSSPSANDCIRCENQNVFLLKYWLCPLPLDPDPQKPKITPFFIKEAYGWAKLESTETKNYFYDASNNQSEVVTREFFEYNPLNKMIAEHQVINPEGEETRSSYTYFTDPAVLAQNRIAEIERIEVHKNGELLQTSQIEYSNTFPGNPSHLPRRILTAKGNQPLESKIRYNRYDAYGNPLEVQQEDGMQIAYVWGYNHTQVVAKIENCSYQAIPAQLLTAIEQATANGSESDVLNALDALRNAPALSQAMVTTVTHIPLVGMSTLTDPKGVRIKYHYDAMNRLEKVTDHYGNIVTENSYNYRP
jgi:hypothetical protein